MSAEVDWLLEQLGTVVADVDAPVKRIDRNNSLLYDGDGSAPDMNQPIRDLKGELTRANFIGAALQDDPKSHGGFGDDYNAEAVVSLRIQGLHKSEYGHIDPTGQDGVPFDELTGAVEDVLTDNDRHPDVPRSRDYHTLFLENPTDLSSDHHDFYDYRLDCRFVGYA